MKCKRDVVYNSLLTAPGSPGIVEIIETGSGDRDDGSLLGFAFSIEVDEDWLNELFSCLIEGGFATLGVSSSYSTGRGGEEEACEESEIREGWELVTGKIGGCCLDCC